MKIELIVKIFTPNKLKHFLLVKISILFHIFLKIINDTFGLFIALIDFQERKKISDNILVCRNKYYTNDSDLESMEKFHIDGTLNSAGYKVHLFYWDAEKSLFFNQVKLWLKIRKLNPWIIFFSSYSPSRKNGYSKPSISFLEILRSKIKSNIIFLWWDSCTDNFYDTNIKKLHKVKSIHLIMENPLLDFGLSNKDVKNDSIIALYTNYAEKSFVKPLKKELDVAFLGQISSYRDNRKEYIDYLIKNKISGYIETNVRGQQVDHNKYAEVLGSAKISINFSFSVDKHQLKGRVFESMHGEALLMETDNPQTAMLFDEGKDYVSFSDKKDMLDKINYYLSHDKEREKIAKSGRKKVLDLYNSDFFLQKIFNHKDFINEKSSNINSNN
jgi:spore maturation protein CgeB